MEQLLVMSNRIAAIERRLGNMMRHGTVSEVDTGKGLMRLNYGPGDDADLIGPWVPYAQVAGGLKVHTPPTVGQQMTVLAPTGDPRQAVALPMTWSDNEPSPADGADPVLTYGDVRIELTEGGVRITVGGFVALLSASGLAMSGGGVGHNGHNIGSSHLHGGVLPGGANTDVPIGGGPTP